MSRARYLFLAGLFWVVAAVAQPFYLPTLNRAIFQPGEEGGYFVPTVGREWPSGTFGCVRSEGWQMHEGLDIKCVRRDKKGEPADSITAAADGAVAYVNDKASLSNYGKYIVLRHHLDTLKIFTLYAHLSRVLSQVQPGYRVKAGEVIAVMGRTANTRQGISRERAHLHFEIDLVANDRYAQWYKKKFPGQRNDHGNWNGQNLLGIDPWKLFLEQRRLGARFSLKQFIASQPVLYRALVRDTSFPWLKQYPDLLHPNAALPGKIVGYELALDSNGLPIRMLPRGAADFADFKKREKTRLLSVEPEVYKKSPCRKLVFKKGQQWVLTAKGITHLDLLTF